MICSNVYGDITIFEVLIHENHKNLNILSKNTIFSLNKKFYPLDIKDYITPKKSEVTEVTFIIRSLGKDRVSRYVISTFIIHFI